MMERTDMNVVRCHHTILLYIYVILCRRLTFKCILFKVLIITNVFYYHTANEIKHKLLSK